MSELNRIRVVDPRIDFAEKPIYTIPESASQITYRQYPATTFSNNNINIGVTLDRKYAISSKMFINVGFRVTITGTPSVGTRLIQIGQDGPRFMPLTSVTQTAEVLLGNQSFAQQLNWYNDALMRYGNNLKELRDDLSCFPSMIDAYQNYSDFLNYGSGMNALGRIGEGAFGSVEPRGGFPYTIISGNGIDETEAVVEFRTYEPVIISPLVWGHNNHKSFINVPTITINYTLSTDISRVWSRSYAGGAANVVVSATVVGVNGVGLGSGPILELITQTPKLNQEIRMPQYYSFADIQPFQKSMQTLQPGETTTIESNNQTLTGVPSRIYIFARRSDSTRNVFTTDTYARLNSIAVQFGNDSGIFTQCSSQQLYNISSQNGYIGSYSDWSRYSGSIFCIDLGKDIPIQNTEATGLQENIQFQYVASFTNIAEVDPFNPAVDQGIRYTLYTVVVYDGLVTITEGGEVLRSRNPLTKEMIANTMSVQKLPYHFINNFSVSGGSFGSKLRSLYHGVTGLAKGAKNVYDKLPPGFQDALKLGAKDVLQAISPRVAGLVEDLGPIAKDVVEGLQGKGYTENQIYHKLLKMKKESSGVGAGYMGGKKMTKAQLKKIKF